MSVLIILLVVLLVLVGTGTALVVSRRRGGALLEPPPDAPRVPRSVLDEVERESLERELEERGEVPFDEPDDAESVSGVIVEELDRREAELKVLGADVVELDPDGDGGHRDADGEHWKERQQVGEAKAIALPPEEDENDGRQRAGDRFTEQRGEE